MTVENEDAKRPSAARLRDWRAGIAKAPDQLRPFSPRNRVTTVAGLVPGLAMPTWVWKKALLAPSAR